MTCPTCRTRVRVVAQRVGRPQRHCAAACPRERQREQNRRSYEKRQQPVAVSRPVAIPAPPVLAPTCPRDGCALLRVETHTDFSLTRRRAVFACGADAWEPLAAAAMRPEGMRPCTMCGEPFLTRGRSTFARKCDGCRTCTACGSSRRSHTVNACPRRAAEVAA